MGQDGVLESLQLRRRIEPQFFAEHAVRVPVDLERLRLAIGTVEGEHELPSEPLAKRLRGDQGLQLRDHIGVAPEIQVGADPLLDGPETHLLEAGDVAPRKRAIREFFERRAAPEPDRISQCVGCLRPSRRPGPATLGQETLEPGRIELVRSDAQEIPLAARHEALTVRVARSIVERRSELGHVLLEHLRRGGGRALVPQLVDQALARNDLVGPQEQERQQRALSTLAEADDSPGIKDLEWAEDAELHGCPSTVAPARRREYLNSVRELPTSTAQWGARQPQSPRVSAVEYIGRLDAPKKEVTTMAQRLDIRPSSITHLRRFATALSALALLLSLPMTASATYPGSIDGRLAMGANINGNFDIYTVLPNGQALQRLTSDPLFDACPAWSADGKRIAWCHGVQAQTGNIDVWTMKADGTEKFQVTDLGGRSFFPDFSPDGSKILFNSRPAGATNFDLFTINPDGTGMVQLTSGPANEVNPAWSPDGAHIVFTSDVTGVGQVYVMDADGSDQVQLTFDDAWKDQVPDWSPDGSKIAYAAGDPGDILVMNADGSNQHTIVGGPTDDFGSAWSPDGGQIAFIRFDDRTVRVANADGSGVHIVRAFGLQAVPGWQPRGDRP